MGNKELIEVVNAPRKIYLQLGDESEHVDDIADGRLDFHSIGDDVTWSSLDDDELSVAYVLQSDYEELKAENARLRAQLDWTPCDVALPEVQGDYQVTVQVGDKRWVMMQNFHPAYSFGSFHTVIAWREFPQAWEGE